MSARFVYGVSRTREFVTWYCQTPGTSWKTDPVIGWQLFHTDGGWLLIAPGCGEVGSGTESLYKAMDWAGPIVRGDKPMFDA